MSKEILTAIEASNRAFEQFVAENDARIKALEAADARQRNRPANGTVGNGTVDVEGGRSTSRGIVYDSAECKAWSAYLRTGQASPELKDMSEVDGPSGGYGVPKVISDTIEALAFKSSPIRQWATVVKITTSDFHKIVNPRGWGVTWIGEVAARPATATPQLIDIVITPRELYANPLASQRLVDDFSWNAGEWIAQEIGGTFGESESGMFLNGTGALQPQGIMTVPFAATADDVRPFGTVMYLPTGLAGGFVVPTATASPLDVLQMTVASLKAAYLDGAAWFMNRSTYATLLVVKNTQGQPVIMPSQSAGAPESLLGFPIVRCDFMPSVAANAFPILFGNMKRAYTIVDRFATRVLVDPYSLKPMVSYYCWRRVGGALVNSEALRAIKVSVA